jgi:GPI-anchor transamidase subunit GAA1
MAEIEGREGPAERLKRLQDILRESGLKVASQKYEYHSGGEKIEGENVYAILQGPRADATEAVVLIAAWRNMDSQINHSGVALVLTLARYFARWSLWSKDIIFLIPSDSVSGPQAWVDAYHDAHNPSLVQSLPIKSGALQGAVAVDYPAGTWGHRFDKLHVVYDGTNGQLPNLDLFNTAVSIASGQMGVGCTLQRMWKHDDNYLERLQTMLRGMLAQSLGHATGPHSSFIPYHVDAITLQTVGDGWQDEMSLGRTLEGIVRSLNNLLEHLHQSFFFYLLMQANRFVSIGTYLPSAMAVAAAFTIMSIALWLRSGRPDGTTITTTASTKPPQEKGKEKETQDPPMTPLKSGDSISLVPTTSLKTVERHMFLPLALLTSVHFLGLVPLYAFNHIGNAHLVPAFYVFTALTVPLPLAISYALPRILRRKPTHQELILLLCFSFLLLGMFLSALATLNFSLALFVGLISAPHIFVRPPPPAATASSAKSPSQPAPDRTPNSKSNKSRIISAIWIVLLTLLSPMTVIIASSQLFAPGGLGEVLRMAGFGWWVWGLWTQVVVWLVWWPSWCVGSLVAASGLW